MKTIRFSSTYTKMPANPSPSKILEVFVVEHELHPSFVAYDTQILDGGKYKLPIGRKLVVLLQTSDGDVWTTIRRHTPDKEKYYMGLRGHFVKCVVEEKNRSLNEFESDHPPSDAYNEKNHGI